MKTKITAFVLLAALATMLVSCGKSHAKAGMLPAKFSELSNADNDPSIEAFRDCGQDGVAFLVEKLKSNDPAVRLKAVGALRKLGRSLTSTNLCITALCDTLTQPDPEISSIAEGALGDIGPQAKPAVPALMKLVSDGTDINGVWALGRIGADASAALPLVEQLMRDKTGRIQVYAAGAVLEIGGENEEARSVIESALAGSDAHVQIDAKNVMADLQSSK